MVPNHVTGTALDSEYRILELAGKGAFGMVYKAKNIATNEFVAIKQLDYSDFSDSEFKAMDQELKIMPLLSHPNIVNYKRVVDDSKNQSIYIVMEYCEGGELLEVIKHHRKMRTSIPEETIWKYLAQLTSALDYMHRPFKKNSTVSKRIVHRDLKPQNIMLTKTGDCKICDFNLCCNIDMSRAKTLAGTLAYLAPEVCSAPGYTEKADLWSLGCIVYQLCELSIPFNWLDLSDILKGPEQKPYKPISSQYSSDLSKIVACLLNPDPSLRYSASDLLLHPRIQIYIQPDQCPTSCPPPSFVQAQCKPAELSRIVAPIPIYESVSQAPQFTAPVSQIQPPAPNPKDFRNKQNTKNRHSKDQASHKCANVGGCGIDSIRGSGIIAAPPYKPPSQT